MKDNTSIISDIRREWTSTNKTIEDIAAMEWQACVSEKRIRNIIYASKVSLKNNFERQVKRTFTEKFLQCQDVQEAILYACNNQPKIRYSISSIRRIIKSFSKNLPK